MLKLQKRIGLYFGIFFLVGIGLAHEGYYGEEKHLTRSQQLKLKKAIGAIATDYQTNVEPIFKVSCFDCHSNATRYPWYHGVPGIRGLLDKDVAEARKHLDMSDGYPFGGHGNLESDLKAIAYQVDKGKMPPFKYRMMHPGSGLTDKQRREVEDWVDRSADKLFQAGD